MNPALAPILEHIRAGAFDAARPPLLKHLQKNPRDIDALQLLSRLNVDSGLLDAAEDPLRRAIAMRPGDPELMLRLGVVQRKRKQIGAAIATLRKGLSLAPSITALHAELRWALADALLFADDEPAADALLVELAQLAPTPHYLTMLGSHYLHTARASDAVDLLRRAIVQHPETPEIDSLLAFALNYDPRASAQDVADAHARFGRGVEAQILTPPPAFTRQLERGADPERPLRLAFISGDLRGHAVSYFLTPILTHLDRARFHVALYSTAERHDETTERLRALAHEFHDVAKLHPKDCAARLTEGAHDVLVELSGHTNGHRLFSLARKPAPVMISYLGYPNTTGLRAIDARLTDALADPPGAEALHVERLIRLDPCAWCYSPPSPAAPDRCPEPALTDNLRDASAPISFGSFNSVFKVSPAIIALWARALREVPGARFVLKGDYRLSGPRGRILAEFARGGIAPDRVTILPMTMDTRSHLETYARVDVALDTYPYTGTTTTCEALHMGVPVVSLASREPRHAARVGLSLLTVAGLPELVTFEPDGYVARAVELARDRERRRTLRTDPALGLRARLASSVVSDAPRFAREFERALREAWRAWCAQ
ncbi:MAG: hypothetical protein SFY95_10845 [Planctomycetota bacterium]|nr:hypothetical protein [Planctomycetota bacterium]